MNVTMLATIRVGDAAGTAGEGAESRSGNGDGFGRAFEKAASKHENGPAQVRHSGSRSSEQARSKPEKESGADDDALSQDDASPASGHAALADLLGRLGEIAALPAGAAATARFEEANASPDGEDGPLKERIVISTVADLAGDDVSSRASGNGVALRVIGMETHFEPQHGAIGLIEQNNDGDGRTASSNAKRAIADGSNPAVAAGTAAATGGLKPRFEEILRTLEPSAAENGGDETASGERKPSEIERRSSASDDLPASRANEPAASRRPPSGGDAKSTSSMLSAAATARTADPAPETSKAPTLGQFVNLQIAGSIVDTLSGDGFQDAAGARSDAAEGPIMRMVAGGAALKTLSIQLEPQDLGRVDVSMRLVNGRLTVELAASEASTAAALAEDRHGLRKILEHAGFALDDAAITIVARDTSQTAAPASASAGSDPGRSSAEQNRSFGSSQDQRRNEENRRSNSENQSASPSPTDETGASRSRAAGTIYI